MSLGEISQEKNKETQKKLGGEIKKKNQEEKNQEKKKKEGKHFCKKKQRETNYFLQKNLAQIQLPSFYQP